MQRNNPATNQPTLFLMIGIPGAGKSTWVHKNCDRDCVVIALDEIRRSLYGYSPSSELYDRLEAETWKIALRETSNVLEAGRNVILDSMALTRDFRRKIIKQLKDSTQRAFDAVAVFVDTPLDLALSRNRGRDKFVKENVLRDLAKVLEPPVLAEGFRAVERH